MGILYSEPMCQAAYDDDFCQIDKLLNIEAKNINIHDGLNGDTPLMAACRRGNIRMVQYLLDQEADVTLRNKKGRTCLHYAARRTFTFLDYLMIAILMPILLIGYLIMVEKQKKNINLMELLLSSRVDINAVDTNGNTALHYACLRKSDCLVSLLLQKNADCGIKNHNSETPLDIARRLQFSKIVKILKKN